MTKTLSILFSVLLFSSISLAQKTLESYIPKDYDTLYGGVAKGDLNKDGMQDVVLALYHKSEDDTLKTDADSGRLLIILFGTASGYKQSAKISSGILCKNCGGAFGDPFSGVEVEKGILKLYHYGGSAWRWSLTHKFRFQNNDWFLIGQTRYSYWNVKECEKLKEQAGLDFEDINFLTGQYVKKKISEDCKLLEDKKGKNKILPLTSLTRFTIDN